MSLACALLRGVALAGLLLGHAAIARDVTDATGRSVSVPDAPARVFAAGPPASVLLYALKPEAMIGWVRAPREAEKPYLRADVRDLPELGRLTGRGDTLNLESLLAARPDLVIDFGTVNPTYRDLAERVQAQTGVPYVLVDGRFDATPAAIRQFADILGVPDRGEILAAYAEQTLALVDATLAMVPAEARPRVYLARGPEGLESAARGAINAEIVERVGAVNVVEAETRGLVAASPELILAWAPDVVVTIDPQFAASVAQNPLWADVPAVRDGRVHLAPARPFGFIDSPPSVNRLIGLRWLLHALYPEHAPGDIREETRDFYRLFYQTDLDDAAIDALLGS